MDSKLIILLILILFGMIAGYMVANGMIDLVSIFSRVTKSQAEENLGGVKLQVDSPVAGVYYQASGNALDLIKVKDTDIGNDGYLSMTGIVKISGKNLIGKTLTISVASPNWYFDTAYTKKTEQFVILYDSNTDEYILAPQSIDTVGDNDGVIELSDVENDLSDEQNNEKAYLSLHRKTGAGVEPFDLPEFVELIFAVGETAKAEVTIVAEPSE